MQLDLYNGCKTVLVANISHLFNTKAHNTKFSLKWVGHFTPIASPC